MFSEQFFDLLLNFGDDWKVDDVKVNFKLEEVDIYVSYISDNAECPDSMELCSIYDHNSVERGMERRPKDVAFTNLSSVCKKTFNPLFINSLLFKTMLNL